MKKEMTCIICPRGCSLTVEFEGNTVKVSGNACPKGEQYAIDETTNPRRTITSTIPVINREDTMVSVKTASPIPKGQIFEVMQHIRAQKAVAPIKIGDIIIKDICGTDIIATKNIE
jgi:CxxC motif-containing protein